MTDFISSLVLIVIGLLAGFLNVTAGGGSLLSLPFLIFLGLPPTVANGTNRIAILIQNIFATARFRHFDVIPREITYVTTIPAVLGALVGAQLAIEIDELLFKRLLAGVILVVMAYTFFGPRPQKSEGPLQISRRRKWWAVPVFFIIGMYGGFIQGGIGFLLITALTLIGYDLVRTNALKVLVVLAFTPFALAVFVVNGQVDYVRGLLLACGNAAGAWLATRVVVEKGHDFIRWLVMGTAVVFAIKLFID